MQDQKTYAELVEELKAKGLVKERKKKSKPKDNILDFTREQIRKTQQRMYEDLKKRKVRDEYRRKHGVNLK